MSKPALIISTVLFMVLAGSCRRTAYYSCYCDARSSNGGIDSIYELGHVSEGQAYQQCFVHNNASDTCMLRTLK